MTHVNDNISWTTISSCRICGGQISQILSYGDMPLAGAFAKTIDGPEHTLIPLRLMWCESCRLMQTGEDVQPDLLFRDYSYRSSIAQPLVDHFRELATTIAFLQHDLVVDIGCNDGVLVRPLRDLGMNVIGVDPSDISLQSSTEEGWPLINEYFDDSLADRIVAEHGHAQVIIASNVFAHSSKIHSMCEGIRHLLATDGVFICEVHYLVDLLESCQFDTCYHEHVFYYSLQSLDRLFSMHGMTIWGSTRIPTHAGSIRVFIGLSGKSRKSVDVGSEEIPDVFEFSRRAARSRETISDSIKSLVAQEKDVWAYGASGRSTILLNWTGLSSKIVSRVVDASPRRIGRLIPGTRIPIVSPIEFEESQPDYTLITAWNYQEMIRYQHKEYKGRWILPLPELTII